MPPLDLPFQDLSEDELERHAAWLRRLARGLVADESAADDLAQGTWERLAADRAARPRRLRPFLAGVARRLARRRQISELRRGVRERAGARTEALPSASEQAARLELSERLAREVAALGPEERTAILLRYYDGLTAVEIARRQGVPAATVRSRLKRGLDRLRSRLGVGDGARGHWGAVLAGWAADGALHVPRVRTIGATGGAWAMASTAKVLTAAAGVALLAGGGWWWMHSSLQGPTAARPEPAPAAGVVLPDDAVTPPAREPSRAAQPEVALAAAEEPAPEASAAGPPSMPWRIRAYAKTEDGGSLHVEGWDVVVVATRAHPGRGTIAPVPQPHVAYQAGVWRPQDDSRAASELEVFEAPPLFASLVKGNLVLDTVELRGGEEKVEFVVQRTLLDQSQGGVVFQVVDAETGERPEKDGYWIAPRGSEPERPLFFPFPKAGRDRVATLVQGPHTLGLGGFSYGERRVEFDVVAGQTVDLGLFELESTCGIVGRVESPLGETLDIAVVARRSGDPRTVGGVDLRNFGEQFAIGSLPPGEIWVTVDDPDWACVPVRFEVHGGLLEDAIVPAFEGTPLTLERPASARGRTRASIWNTGGQVAWSGTLDVGESATLRLVPGSYTLRREPGGERTLDVGGEALRVEL